MMMDPRRRRRLVIAMAVILGLAFVLSAIAPLFGR